MGQNQNFSAADEVKSYVLRTAKESQEAKDHFLEAQLNQLCQAAHWVAHSILNGGKILILGNGGSAADAQHMAAEMVGRMLIERRPLPAIALTTDSSNLTAVGNDYGFEFVFERQVTALCQKQDLVIAISTSGKSKNVLRAVEAAKKIGAKTIGITGGMGGELKSLSDLCLNVELGKNSSRIQETHIFIVHALVDLADRFYLNLK